MDKLSVGKSIYNRFSSTLESLYISPIRRDAKVDKVLKKENYMELELNKPYTSEEIARNLFNVSSKTFSNKRQMYLDKLSSVYK